jgi:hypothetical protein
LNRSKLKSAINNQSIIFVTEDDPWQWVIALEQAISLRKQQESSLVIYIAHSYVKEAKNLMKRLLGWKGSRENVRRSLDEIGINHLGVRAFALPLRQQIFSFSELKEIIYRGTVASTGKRNLTSTHDRLIWIVNFLKAIRISNTLCRFAASPSTFTCFVPNGKIVSAAITVQTLRFFGHKVKILESGSKPDRLHIWNYSAQSQSEADSLMAEMWKGSTSFERDIQSVNYFNGRRNGKVRDPYHLVSWTSLTTKGLIPELEDNKRVATFYSSSQIEQIGADLVPAENFQDQGDALKSVLELLSPNYWVVYLRKHPIPRNAISHFEDEDDIWTKVNGFSHLRVISGESKVDSFALAEKSDLVFHYNSSIGAEIIFYELAPVITTGITSWASLRAGYSALNHASLESLINGGDLQIEISEKILPWALFHSKLGEPFNLAVLGSRNTWEIAGKNIHPTFKSYLRTKLIRG